MAEIYWLLWVEARRNKRYKKTELRANGCDSGGGEGLLELGSQGPGLLGLGLGNRPGGAEFLSKL